MNEGNLSILSEIRDMLKVLIDGQEQLVESVKELKEEQKRLKEEVRFSNYVLNNITPRNEIIN